MAVAVSDAFGVAPAKEGRGGYVGAVQRVVLLYGICQYSVDAKEGVYAVLEGGNLFGGPLVL